ncbi:MAG TPA: hypothetical protein DCS97_02330 [Planctomycetes bacterium]|nr:hypothetical protein [Planctomycetota bacterium]
MHLLRMMMLITAWNCSLVIAGEAENTATIVVTGDELSVNGQTEIPRGLFGVHNMPLSEEIVADWGIDSIRTINNGPGTKPLVASGMVARTNEQGKTIWSGFPASTKVLVECFWDRFQPAAQMTRPDWKNYLTALGRGYGEQAATTGKTHYIEFWNEPYLNWATKPGVNLLGYYYDQTDAAPGKPMRLKTTGEIIPDLVWDRQVYVALKPKSLVLDQWASGTIPQDGKDGETVKLRAFPGSITLVDGATVEIAGPRILRKMWIGKDLTQKNYWSGAVNLRFYIDMYKAFAAAVKEANPQVQLAAGWGFNLFNDNWGCWESLVRPTIDAVHPWMDALHEHHYGGDTRMVAASYEVAYAYTLSRYGKRLKFWNTEAGGHLDPEQPGVSKPANEGDPLLRATAAMTYMLRDIIHMLAFLPDKAFARAAHHPQENGGDEIAFRMLKPLRGTLLATSSSDPRLWSVASREGNRLCVALFNDRRETRRLRMEIKPPAGLHVTAGRRLGSRTAIRQVTGPTGIIDQPYLQLSEERLGDVGPGPCFVDLELGGTSGTVLDFELAGTASTTSVRRWTQQVSSDVLQVVPAKGTITSTITLPAAELAVAQDARLRLVLSHAPGSLQCRLNGRPVALPGDTSWIIDMPLDPKTLRAANTVELSNSSDQPITLASCSLWLQTP